MARDVFPFSKSAVRLLSLDFPNPLSLIITHVVKICVCRFSRTAVIWRGLRGIVLCAQELRRTPNG